MLRSGIERGRIKNGRLEGVDVKEMDRTGVVLYALSSLSLY